MPIEFIVRSASNLVTCCIDTTPTQADAQEFFDLLLAHPGFSGGFNLLFDCRPEGCQLNPAFARAFSKEARNRGKDLGPCRCAFITAKDSDIANVRLIDVLAYGSWVSFASFASVDEAVEWVGGGSGIRRALAGAN